MKTIGLLGGMSWESTVTYYQIINEVVKEKLGGLHSAKILLYSVDFYPIEKYQANGEWDEIADILSTAAKNLQKAGADFIIICANTTHKIAPKIQKRIDIPIIHIAEATAEVLKQRNIEKVILLGTKYTMTGDFYKNKLIDNGISVVVPDNSSIEVLNNIIYEELCLGIISQESKQKCISIIEELSKDGARGVILGCTEIGLLVKKEDVSIPVFDTTEIHATKAVLLAIDKEI